MSDAPVSFRKLLTFVGVAVLCGVILTGLIVPGVAVAGSATSAAVSAFDRLPGELKIGTPAQATTVLASDGSRLATFYTQDRASVPLERMSAYIRDGIVAIEDARFYQHGGIDPTGRGCQIVCVGGL